MALCVRLTIGSINFNVSPMATRSSHEFWFPRFRLQPYTGNIGVVKALMRKSHDADGACRRNCTKAAGSQHRMARSTPTPRLSAIFAGTDCS